MANFLFDPYSTQAFLKGVIPANKQVRANWLQSMFPMQSTPVYTETLTYDKELMVRNTPGQYVAPRVDAPLIQLQGFKAQELRPVYTKYAMQTPDFEQLQGRQMGQQFNELPDFSKATLTYMQKQAERGEAGIEVLKEIQARNIILYGTHTAISPYHPTVTYDFQRTKTTTAAGFDSGYVVEVDLTTLDNGGVGHLDWNHAGNPLEHLQLMVRAVNRRSSCNKILMSNDAYNKLEAYITANYKDAATLTLAVQQRINLQVLPVLGKYQDLTFRRSLDLSGGNPFSGVTNLVDIYTYEAVYNDPNIADYNSSLVKLMPDGYVVALPNDLGSQFYTRVIHPNVNYEPMPVYINGWKDQKTGKWEYESHRSYYMTPNDIDSVVCWKVL